MNHKKRDLERVAFGVAFMFGAYWIYACVLKQQLPVDDAMKTILGMIVLYGLGLGLFLCITRSIPVTSYEKRKISRKTVTMCFLLQFTAIFVLTVLMSIVDSVGGIGKTTEINATSGSMLFLLLVFNPVMEEFVFRKLFADKLLKYGERFYVAVSAFCFALVHGVSLGIPQVMYTFILGMIWAYLFAKTGDIKLVIVMHALSNLCGSIITQTLLGISEVAAGVYSMVLIVLGILGMVLFLVYKKKIILDGESGLFKGTMVKEMLTNKGILFYIVLTVVTVCFMNFC